VAALQADGRSCDIFCLPGPPNELKPMFERYVAPAIRLDGVHVIRARVLRTFGLGESDIASRLGDLMGRNCNPLVGTTASDGVVSVRKVSSEEARKEVAIAGRDPVLDALPADAFPQSLEVMTRRDVDAAHLGRIAVQLQNLPAVEQVETYGAWSERVGRLLMGGVTASGLLALIVLAAVVSVVASTIRLSLQRRRIEVEVLKLVGATDSYVRRPLVLEGAAQGALGSVLALAVLGVLYLVVRSHLDVSLIALLGTAPSFLPWPALVLGVALGTGLGALAAFMSLRRFVST
jgi:cell division transport system permease protein